MAKKKLTRADHERRRRMQANAERLRKLAERGEAALPPERRRPPGASNAEWLTQLAEKAQTELERRNTAEA
jgi:hypothetical protein